MDKVGVRVVGGGPDDWFLVPAQLVEFNMYRLLDFSPPPGRVLEFDPGDLVTTIPLPDGEGSDVLMALNLRIK